MKFEMSTLFATITKKYDEFLSHKSTKSSTNFAKSASESSPELDALPHSKLAQPITTPNQMPAQTSEFVEFPTYKTSKSKPNPKPKQEPTPKPKILPKITPIPPASIQLNSVEEENNFSLREMIREKAYKAALEKQASLSRYDSDNADTVNFSSMQPSLPEDNWEREE